MRLPKIGTLLWAAHRGALVLLTAVPIASCLYWFAFGLAPDRADWKLNAIAFTESVGPWISQIVPFWESMTHRYVPSARYPTVEFARHLLAVCWLSIYAAVAMSIPFVPRFVRTMVVTGAADPAMAYQIRFVALLAWLIVAPTLMIWADFATQTRSRNDYVLPMMTALSAYSLILWICAVLAHRRLGARWRDFKGPS